MSDASTTPIIGAAQIQSLSGNATTHDAVQMPPGFDKLPTGSTLQGYVVNRDAESNPILRTNLGDMLVKTDVFLKTGSDVVLRVVNLATSSSARIISVDGTSIHELQHLQDMQSTQAKQDLVLQSSMSSTPAAPSNFSGDSSVRAFTMEGVVLEVVTTAAKPQTMGAILNVPPQAAKAIAEGAPIQFRVVASNLNIAETLLARPPATVAEQSVSAAQQASFYQIYNKMTSSAFIPQTIRPNFGNALPAAPALTPNPSNSEPLPPAASSRAAAPSAPDNIVPTANNQTAAQAIPAQPNVASIATATIAPAAAQITDADKTALAATIPATATANPLPTHGGIAAPATSDPAGSPSANPSPSAATSSAASPNNQAQSSALPQPAALNPAILPNATTSATSDTDPNRPSAPPLPTTQANASIPLHAANAGIPATTSPVSELAQTARAVAAENINASLPSKLRPESLMNGTSLASHAAPPMATTDVFKLPVTTTNLRAGVMNATVIGSEADGSTILKTPIGTVKLFTTTPPPVNSVLQLEVVSFPAFLSSPTANMANANATTVSVASATDLLNDWGSLGELQALIQANPALVRELADRLPNTKSKLVNNALFFISALRSGDISQWLGRRLPGEIEKLSSDTMRHLSADFSMLKALTHTDPGQPWQMITFPLMHGNELNQARLYVRNDEEKGKNRGQNGTRFVLDITLSRIGDIQLDGLSRTISGQLIFDLILRTMIDLPQPMRDDLSTIYAQAAKAARFSGALSFQNNPESFVHPLSEVITARHGSEGSIIA